MTTNIEIKRGPSPPSFDVQAEWDSYESEQRVKESEALTNEFYEQITSSEHVGVTDLAPYVTILPDLAMTLAERCDSEKFGVRQVLNGILRVGNHGFAIATAYPTKSSRIHKIRPGIVYITQINQEPHESTNGTKFISGIWPDAPAITLGGPSTLVPELTEEGQHFIISAGRKGEIRLQAKKLGKIPFQLLTAISPLSSRPTNATLLDEVGTWAPPSEFIQRKLRLT